MLEVPYPLIGFILSGICLGLSKISRSPYSSSMSDYQVLNDHQRMALHANPKDKQKPQALTAIAVCTLIAVNIVLDQSSAN